VSIRCICLLPLLGCQTKADPPAVDPTVMVEVRDGTKVVASLRPGRPCRASIGPLEMIIGGPPLISQLGETRWTGKAGANGTTLAREGDPVARIFPVNDHNTVGVFDLNGVAMLRAQATAAGATVSDAASRPLRVLAMTGSTIQTDHPALVVTGTHDVLLASVLTAPELSPEVRMLAACERVLVTEKKEL
jgi:antitoxin (DNA-binding transcriptional repressor) of toxin-antitoxin stability system